jgi:hypothetical protein
MAWQSSSVYSRVAGSCDWVKLPLDSIYESKLLNYLIDCRLPLHATLVGFITKFRGTVHLLWEPRYVIARVANLTKENSSLCTSEIPTGV